MWRLCLFFLILQTVNGLPILLTASEVFVPKRTECLRTENPGNSSNRCHPRSDGCNTDTRQCILSSAFGYDGTNPIFTFTEFVWSEAMPGKMDGIINITMAYTNGPSPYPIMGVLQIWKYDYSTTQADIYTFTKRQTYFYDTVVVANLTYTFFNFTAGKYIAVFWDVGGTRFGLGNPEMSSPFDMLSVFPDIPNPALKLKLIPQDLTVLTYQYPFGGTTYGYTNKENFFGRTSYTWYNTMYYLHYAYYLAGPPLFEVFLDNAPLIHNRQLVIEIRTDQGNLIDVYMNPKEDLLPRPDWDNQQGPDPYIDAYKFIYFPMKQGGYVRENGSPKSFARRITFQARLIYKGLPNSEYRDFWVNRRRYGHGTVLATKIMNQNQKLTPEWRANTRPNGTEDQTSEQFASEHNEIIENVGGDERVDLLNVYYLRSETRCPGSSCDNNINEVEQTRGRGMRGYSGNLLSWFDWYADVEIQNGGTQESQGYHMDVAYALHTNNNPTDDYSCSATGTNYIRSKYPFDTACGHQGDRRTFVDAWFESEALDNWLNRAAGNGCAVNANGCIQVEADNVYPHATQCECCMATQPSGGLSWVQSCAKGGNSALLEIGVSNLPLASYMNFNMTFVGSQITLDPGGMEEFGRTVSTADDCEYMPNTLFPLKNYVAGYEFALYNRRENDNSCPFDPNNDIADNLESIPFFSIRIPKPPYMQIVEQYNNQEDMREDLVSNPFRPVFVVDTNIINHNNAFCDSGGTAGPGVMVPSSPLTWPLLTTGKKRQYGPDSTMITQRTTVGTGNIRSSIVSTSQMYARFKVEPTVSFMNFLNARKGKDAAPDTIELEFTITCPLLELGWEQGVGEFEAYCAETWTVSNAPDGSSAIIVSVLEGGYDTLHASYGFGSNQTLREVSTFAYFRIRIVYNSLDTLYWVFKPRVEPELELGQAHCMHVPFEIDVPPKEQVLTQLDAIAKTSTPECVYSKSSVSTYVIGGDFFVWDDVIKLDLPAIYDLGVSTVENQYLHYYYRWTIDGLNIEGFFEDVQLYSPNTVIAIYDRVNKMIITDVQQIVQTADYQNPLLRPPRCLSEQASAVSAVCSINIQDLQGFSGINQFHTCENNNIPYVTLTPRFVFVFPYTKDLNVRAYFFNKTTQFIDIFIDSQRISGITEQDNFYVVYESGSYTLYVNYGRYVGEILQAPCYERMLTEVVVLRPFSVDPQPLVRIPGCVRADDCCYNVPLIVSGNTPQSDNEFDLSNTSLPCYGQPECRWEIVQSPPLSPGAGYCLGITYSITVQNRAGDVANRTSPVTGFPYQFPWRCPTTISYPIPFGGMSPVKVLTVPGKCTDPGTVAEFTLKYVDPTCSGPVSTNNTDPACKYRMFFAIENANPPAEAVLYPGAPTRLGSPYQIAFPYAFTFNLQQTFIWPDQFSAYIPPIPNGFWNAYFWVIDPGAVTTTYASVTDVRKKKTVSFSASKRDNQGLTVIRLGAPQIPQCAGPPILINYVLYDLSWNGPYTILWLTPTGRFISNTTLTEFNAQGCCTLVDINNPCQDCSVVVRDVGIPFTVGINTGAMSPGEAGAYILRVHAGNSACDEDYHEILPDLQILRVQIDCLSTICVGSKEGQVLTEITGGHEIPIEFSLSLSGDAADKAGQKYKCIWDTPEGRIDTCYVYNAPEGVYTINVTDYYGCNASATCRVSALSTDMKLVPVGNTPPNCTGQVGTAVFTAQNCTPPCTLVRVSSNSIAQIGGSYILEDKSVVAGSNTTYAVVDANGCMSPEVSFVMAGAINFYLNTRIVKNPCADNTATGEIVAQVPAGVGAVVNWYFVKTGMLVYVGLHLTGATAGGYRVVAESTIYGCVIETLVDLDPKTGPVLTVRRLVDPLDASLDTFSMDASSPNGPTFTFDIIGITPQMSPQPFVVIRGNTPVGTLDITRLPGKATISIIVTDSGQCTTKYLSTGHILPDEIVPYIPTPLANNTNASRDKDNQYQGLIWVLVPLAFLFGIFIILLIKYNK